MTLRSEGFARLDALIAEHSESWLLSAFVSRIADGESPQEVATGLGLPWFVMRSWLEDSADRMSQWELGKRCFADGLIWESLSAARDADSETVAVARLQADHFSKMAGRLSRDEWGDKQQVEIKTTHTVDIRGLLEAREARLMGIGSPDTTLAQSAAQSAAHLPVTVVQADYADGVI